MSIRRSAAPEIQALVDALSSADVVKRESAIARLAVIGERAVDRLVTAYASARRETRTAILRALEGIPDARGAALAREALREGGEVAVAAAASLRPILQSTDDRAATAALDALVETALSGGVERRVRLAAFESLADMSETVRAPIAAALEKDGGAILLRRESALADATWRDAVEGRLPDDAEALRDAVPANAASAPLSEMQKLVEAVRERERDAASNDAAAGWRQVRGAVHQALALRGSRIALYDLRETLAATAEPLPGGFVAALQLLGDEASLESIAAAWAAAPAHGAGGAWRHQLESAFAAIVKREKVSRRSAALKRIETRFPDAARALSTPWRTTPRRSTRRRT